MAVNIIDSIMGRDCIDQFYPDIRCSISTTKDNSFLSAVRFLMSESRLNQACGRFQIVDVKKTDKIKLEDVKGNYSVFNRGKTGIVFMFHNDEPFEKNFDDIIQELKDMGWDLLSDVSLYVDKTRGTYVFQSVEKKCVIIISKAYPTHPIMQMAASCMTRLFPWCFEGDLKPTDDELLALRYLYEGNDKQFTAAMEAYYNAADFYGKMLGNTLAGFCKINIESQIKSVVEENRGLQNDIDRIYTRIRELTEKINRNNMNLIYARNQATKSDKMESEMVDFLKMCALDKHGNGLVVLEKNEHGATFIRFGVTTYLCDYDEDAFSCYVANADSATDSDSYVFSYSPYTFEETKRLFLAIWEERRFKVRVYCSWRLYSDGHVMPIDSYDEALNKRGMMKDRLPQPHLVRYGCIGGYRGIFADAQQRCDYVGILNTIIASSSCISWDDSTVVEVFMDSFFSSSNKCLEDEDGNLFTVKEVVEKLNAEAMKKE